MKDDTATSMVGRHGLRAVNRTRKSQRVARDPALVAARTRLRQVAQDLRRNRQDLAALARGLRTAEPAPENSHLCSDGAVLSVEDWAADCAEVVAGGLDDLAKLAETFAGADWRADVTDWIEVSSQRVAAARSRK
jgi:hypothetical protein